MSNETIENAANSLDCAGRYQVADKLREQYGLPKKHVERPQRTWEDGYNSIRVDGTGCEIHDNGTTNDRRQGTSKSVEEMVSGIKVRKGW